MKTIIRIIKTLITLSIVLSLGACSSSNKIKSSKKPLSKSQQAAQYNARLGAEYTRKGHMRLANEKLTKALEQDPRSGEANHYFALLQQRLNDQTKADTYFRRALRLSPKNPQLRNNYGSHLCRNGQYQAATQQFLTAVNDPLYTTPEFAYTNAGICIKKAGDRRAAEQYFRKSLSIRPSFGSALFQMAKLNYDFGDYARADAFLQRYQQHNPDLPESLVLCTQLKRQLGDTRAANRCQNKLATAFPASLRLANYQL